ncbi:hypothetical protein GCM10011351_06840 [Paraliobacillus quinghaiensis]|uniref:DUF5067 domain-containing protein n=1 Tax=Paraliobacillus quinghaiensis TaxID=470815 RepID=A0A917WRL3_9BACI|nr:hypothetical protein [Paraliobacillus quinghaiensis]GGM23688.1 hypothetical protein GCM10011351_06840 [Paraliobacillus quinghaiensis]
MKKYNLFYLFSLLSLLLFGCGLGDNATNNANLDEYEVTNSEAEVTEGDFIYRLVSEKEQYDANGPVEIYAELEYVGDQEEIEIFHAASPFYFPMHEKTRDYKIGYGMVEPLLSTTLVKGEPLREEYTSAAGYSADEDNDYINFIEKINNNEFPVGYYKVNGFADFFVRIDDISQEKYKIHATIDFMVLDEE